MNELKKDLSIPMSEASLKSLLIAVPLAIIQTVFFTFLHGFPVNTSDPDLAVFGFLLLIGIFVHELIHMFTWALFGRKPLSVFVLGFQWKSFTPYTHCKESMEIQPYRIGTLAPGLLLGLLPWLISLLSGDFLFFIFGLLYTTAACGDFLILWIIRNVKPNTLVEDHPANAGCFVIDQSL